MRIVVTMLVCVVLVLTLTGCDVICDVFPELCYSSSSS
ncbi:MAG: hypothetical protein BWZ08_00115 [candidate division BRC1 bacterium ADurb.BinA292]|nr:MAG: hypothetical protein BWZ08_00115 [candidate division BRC1 bacterium ADurb.BinA292]